jgi:hypothetical protein
MLAKEPAGCRGNAASLRVLPVSRGRGPTCADTAGQTAAKLACFDIDGDGEVSLDEILLHGAELEHQRLRVRARRTRRLREPPRRLLNPFR